MLLCFNAAFSLMVHILVNKYKILHVITLTLKISHRINFKISHSAQNVCLEFRASAFHSHFFVMTKSGLVRFFRTAPQCRRLNVQVRHHLPEVRQGVVVGVQVYVGEVSARVRLCKAGVVAAQG